jgi:anti-sigma factor RsiW
MTTTHDCPRAFDEELLTGYLDGMLAQGERQRVELHLEDCASCRELFAQLEAVRSAARATSFRLPLDLQWRETPRHAPSRALRGAGWLLLVAWLLATAGFALVQIASSGEPLWEKLLVFGGLSGAGLLLVSVLLDRLHDLKTDRYRRVLK